MNNKNEQTSSQTLKVLVLHRNLSAVQHLWRLFIHNIFLGGTFDYPEEIEIKSTGAANRIQSDRMGIFHKMDENQEGRPIYKNRDTNEYFAYQTGNYSQIFFY